MNKLIDFAKLRRFCEMNESAFSQYTNYELNTLYGDVLYFKDNHSKVLAVGHLDTVFESTQDKYLVWSKNRRFIYSPQLDDRLGVYLILDVLPKMGINVDVLLTSNEERCLSTAADFMPDEFNKQYNWIVELDRAGNDVVNYEYGNKTFNKLLLKYFLSVNHGSYTDICEMEYVGCKAFNIGIGSYYQHTYGCYADLSVTLSQLVRFKRFYDDNRDRRLSHKINEHKRVVIKSYESDRWGFNKSGFMIEKCKYCGEELIYTDELDSGICRPCIEWNKVNGRAYDE